MFSEIDVMIQEERIAIHRGKCLHAQSVKNMEINLKLNPIKLQIYSARPFSSKHAFCKFTLENSSPLDPCDSLSETMMNN